MEQNEGLKKGAILTGPVLAYMVSNIITQKLAGRLHMNIILRAGLIMSLH